jgi:uncharacterized protein YpmB
MSKNTIVSIFVIIIVVILGIVFWKYSSNKEVVQESPIQALEKETAADTTDKIDANLNAVDVNTDADLKAIDDELNNF